MSVVEQGQNNGREALPEATAKRLAELEGGLFTSDLSVNEFLLVKEAGFHPVGLVMGSSIYHVGRQLRRWSRSQELTTLSQAMYNAREAAMERMETEASELGADGVVGVRLDVNYYEWGAEQRSSSRSALRSSPRAGGPG